MAYVLILLSLLALAGAVALWRSDPSPAPSPLKAPASQPEPEPAAEALPEPAPEADPKPDPEPEPEAGPEPETQDETDSEPEREPVSRPAPRPHRKSGLQLPGASRRERRAWAERHNFDFTKQDDLLAGEWERGAAAGGEAPKDIASGSIYGHDTHVMDLGGVTVMAMRTGAASDVVVDMRRVGFTSDSSSDLVEVEEVGDFTVHATEAGPAQRFLDVRVRTALDQMPAAVAAVWCETEWVLAQASRDTVPGDWDAMLAPLGLIADAARVLPPQTWRPVEAEYATREMGRPLVVAGGVEKRDEPTPIVQRPEEPLEMPTRATGGMLGTVDHRAVGSDEVEAIADGLSAPLDAGDLTRVRRDQSPPSIFDD
ncbi:hypothetical protein CAPI_08495 [Corynebacterium capitovis DSM 44611]|uniref:hypothetical protein n=1 Tax=Corynebacterium capitovis TaxID=131081 RepID=UPI00037DC21A|nr:hypothetical protein [Corynebacterium capitovis]WKD58226.1 hypothetical protein CAPI_08495 [Corynebacterium capitovis DSM 44611]